MRNFLIILSILAALGAAVFQGCDVRRDAQDNLQSVAVFADPEVYSSAIIPLKTALERVVDTPQPETWFSLEHPSWEEFNDYTNYANIMLIGTLQGEGEVSMYVKESLDEGAEQGVQAGDLWIFRKQDPWYGEQLLTIIAAPNQAALREKISEGSQELFLMMKNSALERVKKDLYAVMEEKELAQDIREKYGFQIRIQHDYQLIREEPELNFIRLRRMYPDRWLTIYWAGADTVTDSLMIAERQRVGQYFADPVKLHEDYLKFFSGERAYPGDIVMRGLWSTVAPIGGGPFFTYAYKVPNEDLVYFIDGSAFAPDREKLPLLMQLEVMAQTFQPPE